MFEAGNTGKNINNIKFYYANFSRRNINGRVGAEPRLLPSFSRPRMVEKTGLRTINNMADDTTREPESCDDGRQNVPPWASGEGLRHVEKDVLIPKIMRERARTEKCKDLVEGEPRT